MGLDWCRGPKRKVREVAARLTEDPFAKPSASKWDYEAAEIDRLDEIKERLEAGEFLSQKEIADHFGVSRVMAGKSVKKGISIGLWSHEQIGRWMAKGKARRSAGETKAPIRVSQDWQDETLSDDSGGGASFEDAL